MQPRYALACALIRQLDTTRLLCQLDQPLTVTAMCATEDLTREWDGLPPLKRGYGFKRKRH